MYKNDDIRMHRADDKKNSITISNIDYWQMPSVPIR